MQLTEKSIEKTPEEFYSKFDTESNTWLETETFLESDHIRLRRRAVGGWQDIAFYVDHLKLLYVTLDQDDNEVSELIAEGQVYLEYLDWDANEWKQYSFGAAVPTIIDANTIKCTQETADASLEVLVEWKIGSAKQTYTATYSGQKIRVGGIVKVINPERLTLDYSDFLGIGLVNDQEQLIDGSTYRFLTFASDGVDDELEVDPYLSVEEPAGYVNVTCDGYMLRFRMTDSYGDHLGYVSTLSDPTNSIHALISAIPVAYHLGRVHNKVYTILENSSNRVVINITGNPISSSDVPLPQVSELSLTFTIYKDKFFVRIMLTTTGDLDCTGNYYYHYSLGVESTTGLEQNVREDNGSEIDVGNWGIVPECTYVGIRNPEIDISLLIEQDAPIGSVTTNHFFAGSGDTGVAWHSGTLNAGVHTQTLGFVIDSVEREGGKRYDGSMDVLANVKIDDSFDTDTSEDYIITGGTGIFGEGKVISATPWTFTDVMFDTSSDMLWVKTTFINRDIYQRMFLNIDTSTNQGYVLIPNTGRDELVLFLYNDGVVTYVSDVNLLHGAMDPDQLYTLYVKKIAECTYAVYLDNEYLGTVTDAAETYSGGTFAGFGVVSTADAYSEMHSFSCGTYSANKRLALGEQLNNTREI